LFSVKPTQTSIETSKDVEFKPMSTINDDSPVEFVIPGNGDEYWDLSSMKLYVKASILKSDGTKPADTQKDFGPVNNFMHSIFSQVDFSLNHKQVSSPNTTYPYRAYLENLLNYGNDAKESHLTSVLFFADTYSHMDSCDDSNQGMRFRRHYAKKGFVIDMIGPLHIDVCNQDKLLLNGVEMRVRLIRAKNEFALMSSTDTKYKIDLKEVSMFVRRCKINPSILIAHHKTLAMGTAKYPITRVEVKSFTLPSHITGKTLDNVFFGQLPKRVIIGLVSNAAFNGDFKKNPFNFHHYDMNYFSLYVDGEQVPSKPLQPDFTSSRSWIREYETMFSGTGIHFKNLGTDVARAEYAYGYTLLAFDLTPDMSAEDSGHWNLVRNGNLRIEIGFKTALPETINCIVYAEMDNVIEIDRDRNVTVDF